MKALGTRPVSPQRLKEKCGIAPTSAHFFLSSLSAYRQRSTLNYIAIAVLSKRTPNSLSNHFYGYSMLTENKIIVIHRHCLSNIIVSDSAGDTSMEMLATLKPVGFELLSIHKVAKKKKKK